MRSTFSNQPERRWKPSALLPAALLALAAILPLASQAAEVGKALPDLKGAALEGDVPAVRGKVVLVDFWASWCGPCKESFPAMEELHKKYAAKGLVILAVNVDEDIGAMKDFLKDHAASFTIVHDATKKLVGTANIASMPSSIVIGKDGKVVSIHKGFHGKETVAQYEKDFAELLSATVAGK